jgi:hypothetical protein
VRPAGSWVNFAASRSGSSTRSHGSLRSFLPSNSREIRRGFAVFQVGRNDENASGHR